MKAKYRKILCPIEFERISISAIEIARNLAKKDDAAVYLLCVVPADRSKLKAELEHMAHDSLRGIAHKWLERKVRYKILVRTGRPAAVIIEAAEETGADLIVMATHGRTGKNLVHLGSVTEQVVRQSTRPVLTIKPT